MGHLASRAIVDDMEAATGGFRSLRCHVKAAKDAESEAERREGGDREEAAQTVELQRQRLWEEEQQLNGLRVRVLPQTAKIDLGFFH